MSISKIDPKLCTGCGLCVNTCPMDVIRLNPQPIREELLSPCATGCPAGVSVRKYSYYLQQGMTEAAARELREYIPFPSITGRVCPHTCESKCARSDVDGAVNIRSLERYVGDLSLNKKAQAVDVIYSKRVAVIGAGPAGLSCAFYLCRKGYSVTVFESGSAPGGTMRTGIPEYRLPKHVLNSQIDYIRDMGVEIRTGVTFGKDIDLDDVFTDFQAAYFAIGLQSGKKLEIEGSELTGTISGIDFLRSASEGTLAKTEEKVLVIGGGNVALSAALSAARLGSNDVSILCLENEREMPAFAEEIAQAKSENIKLFTGVAPQRVIGENGKATALETIACTQLYDDQKRYSPVFNESEKQIFDADMIIFAIGQSPNISSIPAGIKLTASGTIAVDPVTLETSIPGLFAGGDIVESQNASVAKAAASGKRAAESIHCYLVGEDMQSGRDVTARVQKPPCEGVPLFSRRTPAELSPEQRIGNFNEVNRGFTENEARLEAQRCMTCGSKAEIAYPEDCMVCLFCERDCPSHAIYVAPDRPARHIAPWDLG